MSEENNTIPSDFDELMEEEPVLRCNRCNTPITPGNAVLTPTGYRCKACVRGQQKVYDTSKTTDPIIAFVISAAIAFGGSWLVNALGFIVVLVATGLGLLIYNATRLALNRRRGKSIDIAILIGAIVGASPLLIRLILQIVQNKGFLAAGGSIRLLWYIVYMVLLASSAYAQSRGGRR